MWILYSLVLHLLLLGSIFVIYFRSPVIEGLKPQVAPFLNPPSDRLVLIVTDGLRADSFFANNCNNVPHLREIFLRSGLVGISRTHVPTESRPGHIALIAGLYEDPSAVTRGWKENPIDFDTIFNRSTQTYAWGAHDVLHIFEKLSGSGRPMHFDSYNHDLDFSGQHKTYKLDEWVFDRVELLLDRKKDVIRGTSGVVFFLHLLGLDTAGHVHKPDTPLFLENLNFTQYRIAEIYKTFERIFPDKRTVYLLTSDHGMTNSGSHGAGAPHETDTPFMLWGECIKRRAPKIRRSFAANSYGKRLPLHEVEQAQLTPLMAALLGVPTPMNNLGILPLGFMNVSENYEAQAAYSNTMQLLAQYMRLHDEHQQGLFAQYMREYKNLSTENIRIYRRNAQQEFELGQYNESLQSSLRVMREAVEGINFYHGYYRNVLLLCTTATYIGWILYLYRMVIQGSDRDKPALTRAADDNGVTLTIWIIGGLIVGFIVGQRVPFAAGLYLLLPLPIWLLALRQPSISAAEEEDNRIPIFLRHFRVSKLHMLLLVVYAELLVYTFFQRYVISVCFIAFAFYSNWSVSWRQSARFYIWVPLVLVLSCFPLLPPSVGYQNHYLLFAGLVLLLLRSVLSYESRSYTWQTHCFNTLTLINTGICVFLNSQQMAVPWPLRVANWLFLIYAFGSIAVNKQPVLEIRLSHIIYNLGTLYTMLCTSYESLFVQLLAKELAMALRARSTHLEPNQQRSVLSSLHIAFTILLYTFFSLFGSGNIASISSFDPNISRCFVTHFAPFVMMFLVLIKLLLPVLLVMCIVYTYSEYARQHERQVFICLLILCDVMGLNFLFLVRNTGSWLEIGSSISHFVIMEVTTLILLLISYVAKLLLHLNGSDVIKQR